MLKKFYLSAVILVLLSCSKEDISTDELLLGVWEQGKYIEVFENGIEKVYEYPCKDVWIFKSEGDVDLRFLHLDDNDNCVEYVEENVTMEGWWEKSSESEYIFIYTRTEYFPLTQLTVVSSDTTDNIEFKNSDRMILRYNTGYEYYGMYFEYTEFEFTRLGYE